MNFFCSIRNVVRTIKDMKASRYHLEIFTGNSKWKLELFYHTTKDVIWEKNLHPLLKYIDMRL